MLVEQPLNSRDSLYFVSKRTIISNKEVTSLYGFSGRITKPVLMTAAYNVSDALSAP